MLKLNTVEMSSSYKHGYDPGSVPGIECKVEFQVGDKSYDKVSLTLSDDATKRIVEAIAAEAIAMLVLDAASIDVTGKAGVKRPVEDAEKPVVTLRELEAL